MTSKQFTALIISIVSLFPLYELVQGLCADVGYYEAESTFFQSDITARPAYRSFYYIEYPKYYDDGWYNPSDSLPDANIAEWETYTANAVPNAALDSLIYGASYEDLKSLYAHIEKGTPLAMNTKYTTNAFTRWLKQAKDYEALGYLMYAKQCEPYAVNASEWEAPEQDTARMNRLIKNGLQLYAAAKSPLIRDKYAFQVVRMSFYSGNNAKTLQLFDKLVGERAGGGYTYARALELRAGALYRMKRRPEAALLYARVFDLSDNRKHSAFVSFDWCVGQDAAPVLKRCKTDHERAVVYVMDGLHEFGYALPAMQAAYSADLSVAGLDVVMTREINKLEQCYQRPILYAARNVSSNYYQFYYYSREQVVEAQQHSQYLAQLNAFAQQVAASKGIENKAFWNLSSSYLYFMQGNMADCKRMMEAAKQARMSGSEQDMYHTLQIIYAVRNSGTMNPALEAQLLPDLKWLKGHKEGQPFRYAMKTLLTTAYLKGGDTVKAIYAMGLGNTYNATDFTATDFTDEAGSLLERMSIPKLQEMQAFAARKDKTPYERWLTDSSIYTASSLYELEGTKYIRRHQFAKAIAALQKGDERQALVDPFSITVSEVMKWAEDDSLHLVSKLYFAKRMAALEERLAKVPDDPALLMEYAAGLYNMTYYGNAFHAYAYYRSSLDDAAYFMSPKRQAMTPDAQEYYGAMKAENTFARAAVKSTNKEQQAKALFMAAKCWQKRCPGGPYDFYDDDQLKAYYVNCLKNPYFLQLTTASAQTAFYEGAVSTCGYLRDYEARK
jgi:hypothetical protein